MSPVCGQYRRRFRFTAAVPLPPGMPEGAVAPSPFFRRRGRVPRRGAIFCLSGRNDLPSSSISSVPKTSAEGKSLPIYRHRSSSSGDAGRGRRPFRSLPPARKQFVSHQQSMPSALPIYRRCPSSSGDAGRGAPSAFFRKRGRVPRRGNNLSPVCGQCRQRFRFTAAVPLPPGCRKGPPPLPLSSAGGGVYPAEERFSVCQDATTCRPLLFHPFRKPLPKENRFRYIKVRVRQCRARTFMLLAKEDVSSLANFLTGENLPPTRSAAASPSTGSWSPRRFPTHNAHRDRSAPRTSCTSRPTAQPSLRQW